MSDYDFDYLRFQDLTGRLVRFPDHGTWQIGRRLAIKERISFDGGSPDFEPSEAQAVYECSQSDGLHVGQAAILKLRIQSVHTRSLYYVSEGIDLGNQDSLR